MNKILPFNWELPKAFTERLGDEAGHQRIMDEEDHLLIVAHKVPIPDDELRRDPEFFWRSPDGTWRGSAKGAGFQSMFTHIDSFLRTVTALDDLCDRASDASTFRKILTHAVPLRRSARHLAAVLREARRSRPEDRGLILARDKSVAVERACDLLVEDGHNGLDYLIATRAEAQAEASATQARAGQRLNLLAALFLPLTTIASIFGMNMQSGIDESSNTAFWAVIVGGIVVGIIAVIAISRAGPPDSGKTSTPDLPAPRDSEPGQL